MTVGELRRAIVDIPDNLQVEAWTTGDSEFVVRIATIFTRGTKQCLFLGNDPDEYSATNEKVLWADEIEGEK